MSEAERELMFDICGGRTSWLWHYVDYARSLTDAPLAFHVGAGLVALAGAAGSRLSWTGGGGRENWPNLYLLLLAPSGIYRKSTSVDLACSLLERACPGVVMDREFSPERFIRNLAQHPTSVLKEAEFASLLERMKATYMSGLKQRLTELYDCVPEYARNISGAEGGQGGERIRIMRPALSILSASTTDWLVASITEMDLRSGFLPRFLMISSETREPEPAGGYWAERDMAAENRLVQVLGEIAHRPSAHLNVSQVRDQLVTWDTKARKRYEVGAGTDELAGLYARLAHSAAKLCALLTVAEEPAQAEYTVLPQTATRATRLMDWILKQSEATYAEHLVFEKFERLAQKALLMISHEGTERREILRRLHLPVDQMNKLLDTLRERGQVDVTSVATGGRMKVIVRRLYEPVTEVPEGDANGDKSSANGVADVGRNGTGHAWVGTGKGASA